MARWTPDPTFYPSPRLAGIGPAGDARLRRPGRADAGGPARRARRDRPPAGIVRLRLDRLDARDAEHRRRAAPLRLERVQRGALPVRAAAARRTPLPARARPALLAHARHRHQARPARAAAGADDRGRGHRPPHRLLAAAHDPLRPRRDLRLRARGRQRRRRGRRHLPARLRLVRPAGRLGGRPRPPALQLRLLVAPRIRHPAVQRVGHPGDVRERRRPREAARPRVRPSRARLGSAQAPPQAGARPRRPASDGARAAAGARSAQDLRVRRRGRVRRGSLRLGLAVAPRRGRLVDQEGDRRSRPSRPRPTSCRRC